MRLIENYAKNKSTSLDCTPRTRIVRLRLVYSYIHRMRPGRLFLDCLRFQCGISSRWHSQTDRHMIPCRIGDGEASRLPENKSSVHLQSCKSRHQHQHQQRVVSTFDQRIATVIHSQRSYVLLTWPSCHLVCLRLTAITPDVTGQLETKRVRIKTPGPLELFAVCKLLFIRLELECHLTTLISQSESCDRFGQLGL